MEHDAPHMRCSVSCEQLGSCLYTSPPASKGLGAVRPGVVFVCKTVGGTHSADDNQTTPTRAIQGQPTSSRFVAEGPERRPRPQHYWCCGPVPCSPQAACAVAAGRQQHVGQPGVEVQVAHGACQQPGQGRAVWHTWCTHATADGRWTSWRCSPTAHGACAGTLGLAWAVDDATRGMRSSGCATPPQMHSTMPGAPDSLP